MEFFNNTKNFGLLILILSVISIVFGVYVIIDDGVSASAIGGILSSLVMILAGIAIFSQTDGGIISFAFPEGSRSKFGALTGFIFATGISNILSLTVGGIVLGAIILLTGWIITNDKDTIIDSIVWVLLIVLFALIAISSVLATFAGGIYILIGIFNALLYLTAFLYLLDKDVKKKLVK